MTKICITKNKQMNIFFICTEMKAFIHRIIKNMYSKMPHLRISITIIKQNTVLSSMFPEHQLSWISLLRQSVK